MFVVAVILLACRFQIQLVAGPEMELIAQSFGDDDATGAVDKELSSRESRQVAYTDVYGVDPGRNPTMQRRAKVFMNNRSQAVRLPKEFQFSTGEVFIRKEGEDVILSPRPIDWGPYLESGPVASDAFMEHGEDLPVQEREP